MCVSKTVGGGVVTPTEFIHAIFHRSSFNNSQQLYKTYGDTHIVDEGERKSGQLPRSTDTFQIEFGADFYDVSYTDE